MAFEGALDGNAAASILARIFDADVTTAVLTCAACSAQRPVGELRLYGGGPGKVLRCRSCGEVNVRIAELGDRLALDLRGSAKMVFDLARDTY